MGPQEAFAIVERLAKHRRGVQEAQRQREQRPPAVHHQVDEARIARVEDARELAGLGNTDLHREFGEDLAAWAVPALRRTPIAEASAAAPKVKSEPPATPPATPAALTEQATPPLHLLSPEDFYAYRAAVFEAAEWAGTAGRLASPFWRAVAADQAER